MESGRSSAEQNALPGLTNRILGRFVDRGIPEFFRDEKMVSQESSMTGNPDPARFSWRKKTSSAAGLFYSAVFGRQSGPCHQSDHGGSPGSSETHEKPFENRSSDGQ